MIVLIILCVMFAFITSLLVVGPLFLSPKSQIDFHGFSCEEELNDMVHKRAELLNTLIESEDPSSQTALLSALEIICGHFQKAGLPPLPMAATEKKFDLTWPIMLASLLFPFYSPPSFGSEKDKDFPLPPPAQFEDDYVAQINQFVIHPGLGEIQALYRGIFSIGEHTEFYLRLPLPEGFESLRVEGAPNGILHKDVNQHYKIKSEWKPGVHTISAEFTLPANNGAKRWVINHPVIGFVVLMFPFKKGVLSDVMENINFPPPKIVNRPQGFKWQVIHGNPQDSQDINRKQEIPMLHGVRMEKDPFLIPSFEIAGILPSRNYLILIATIQSFWLIGALAAYLYIQNFRNKKQINSLETASIWRTHTDHSGT